MDVKDIRIFVAYGDAMASELLVAALKCEPGFTVVGSANGSADLPEKIISSGCDVALISADLQDGQLRGHWVLRQLRELSVRTRCVLLLDRSERRGVVDAFRAGARGVFCPSASDFKMLCQCVVAVYSDEIWLTNPEIAYIVEAFSELVPLRVQNAKGEQLLTRREEQLVYLLAEGLSNREIARELRLSEHTVKNYLFRMLIKWVFPTGLSWSCVR